jgi:hypothetical protein
MHDFNSKNYYRKTIGRYSLTYCSLFAVYVRRSAVSHGFRLSSLTIGTQHSLQHDGTENHRCKSRKRRSYTYLQRHRQTRRHQETHLQAHFRRQHGLLMKMSRAIISISRFLRTLLQHIIRATRSPGMSPTYQIEVVSVEIKWSVF